MRITKEAADAAAPEKLAANGDLAALAAAGAADLGADQEARMALVVTDELPGLCGIRGLEEVPPPPESKLKVPEFPSVMTSVRTTSVRTAFPVFLALIT